MPKKLLLILVAAFLLFAIPTRSQSETPLKLLYSHDISDIVPMMANDLGYFKDEGLDVELQPMDTPLDSLKLVEKGNAQFITVTGAAIVARAKLGIDIKIVLVDGMQQYFLNADSRKGIRTLADLFGYKNRSGKKALIAIANIGTFAHLITIRAFLDSGYNQKQIDDNIEFLPVGNTTKRFNALVSGNVEAAVLLAPTNIVAEMAGFPIVLSRDKYPQTADQGLTVKTDYLKNNPVTVEKMIRAFYRAMNYISANPDKTKEKIIFWFGLEKQALKANELYFEINKKSAGPPITAEIIADRIIAFMKGTINKSGIISSASMNALSKMMVTEETPPDVKDFTDFSVANKVRKELYGN